jgi:hypothetical protein
LEQNQSAGKKKFVVAPEVLRELRKTRRESQFRFWSRFGVTQTRGSRFEMGTRIPQPIVILLKLYFEGVISDGDLWRVRRTRSQATTC